MHCLPFSSQHPPHSKYYSLSLHDALPISDMFSGWGIRTLSAKHPAYNPYAYHRGTVWPVENAVFALAFARYGLHERSEEHTSDSSHMSISYAVFCLIKTN